MKKKLCTLLSLFAFFCIGAEKPLVVWMEYYPQLKLVVDEYNAGAVEKLKILPSVTSWPKENMRAPDGSSARAFVSSDLRIPHNVTTQFHKVPIWNDGIVFFMNKNNPAASKLGKKEISPEVLKWIWTGTVFWEDLTGDKTSGRKTPVRAYSANRRGIELFTGSKEFTYNDTGWNSGVTFHKVHDDLNGLGTVELRNSYSILLKASDLRKNLLPIALKKLKNGNYILLPVKTDKPEDGFSQIIRNGELLPFAFCILTKDANDPIGKELAGAAQRLGSEKIFEFGYLPLSVGDSLKKAPPKFVFAHAMSCFLFGGVTDYGRKSAVSEDDFANWPSRDNKFRTWWSKEYSKYARERSVKASKADLDLAADAGLDAIGILLSPYMLTMHDSPFRDAIVNMIKAADQHKVKIIPDVWDFFTPAANREEQHIVLNYFAEELLTLMKQYPNAFYRHNGKFVICFGDPVGRGEYSKLEPLFHLFGGKDSVFLIAGIRDVPEMNEKRGWIQNPDMLTSFAVHLSWGDQMLENLFYPLLKQGKSICWPVSSSMYTNTGEMNRNQKAESLGAARMIDLWRQAIRNNAGAVYIASWNDFSEDHHITHSNYRGDTFLRITNYFANWFRTGKMPAIEEERLFLFHHRQLIDAKITEGKWRGIEPSWQSTPFTDYVHVVTMLKKPGALELKLGAETVSLPEVPAGFHEWLVYVPRIKDYHKNHPVWNKGSYENPYPEKNGNRSITKIKRISSCRPVLNLKRDGKTVGTVSARTDLAGTARFSDQAVVGNSAAVR